jgi:hypothetical protein
MKRAYKSSAKTPTELATTAAGVIEQLVAQLQFVAAVDQDVELILRDADRWLDDYHRASEIGPESNQYGDEAPKVATRINGRCVWCGEPMEVPQREQGGGRTKRFCSPAHRIAHHRWKTDPYAPEPPIGSTLTR